mmetsp:Transcript_19680/g.22283  ORF Transcript_19680/g.22283 Transcript_19680/m.22283 type:complete len:198 (-) Transcript_19680:46-639(-)
MVCSMEETVCLKVLNNGKGKVYSRRKKHLAICSDPNCNVVCHSCNPEESKIRKIPAFRGLSCFEIAHHPDCENLFIEVCRNGKNGNTYTRSVLNHPVPKMITKIYEKQLPRRCETPPTNSNEARNQETPPIRKIQRGSSRITSADARSIISNITTTPPVTKPAKTATTTSTRAKKRNQKELDAARVISTRRSTRKNF